MFVCLVGFLSLVSSWENFSPRVPPREASLLFPEKGLSTWPTHRLCLASHHYCVAERVFFLDHCLSTSKYLLTAYTGSVALVTLLLKVPRNSGQQTWHQDFIQKISKRSLGLCPDLFSAVVTDVLSHQPAIEEFVQVNGWVSKAFT